MTTTELSQVVNIISKSEPYLNDKVGFSVTVSDIKEIGYKVHLFHLKEDCKPQSFTYIKEYSIFDRGITGTNIVASIWHNAENERVEMKIF